MRDKTIVDVAIFLLLMLAIVLAIVVPHNYWSIWIMLFVFFISWFRKDITYPFIDFVRKRL